LDELYGGARINYTFNEIFAQCLNNMDPLDGLSMNDIRTTIRNATGPRAALFIPEVSFELLVKRQIARFEDPSLQCVEMIYEELQRIVAQLDNKELSRFATLKDRVIEVVNQQLQKYRVPTRNMIENLIRMELSFINTNHPDFVGGDGAITSILEKMVSQKQDNTNINSTNPFVAAPTPAPLVPQKYQPKNAAAQKPNGYPNPVVPSQISTGGTTPPPQGGGFLHMFFGSGGGRPNDPMNSAPLVTPTAQSVRDQYGRPEPRHDKLQQIPASIKAGPDVSEKEKFETELIKQLLCSYFNVVRKNMKDMVPKSIIYFLVNSSKENIQNELVSALYKEELFDELLEENASVSARRKSCQAMIEILRKAHDIINEVRDFSVNNPVA